MGKHWCLITEEVPKQMSWEIVYLEISRFALFKYNTFIEKLELLETKDI